jgi:two-component system cell cycle sensor histidine kinase/response regulator CckA
VILSSFDATILGCTLVAAMAAFVVGRRLARGEQHREVLRSRSLFDETQQIAHIGSWELDFTANTISWSDESYRIVGMEPQSQPATLELFYSFVHPDDRELVRQAIDAAPLSGTFEFEFRVVRADGTVRHVLDRGHATVRNGVLVRLLGTVQDLTDQRASGRALDLARLQQKALLDNLPDLVFLKDLESRFVAVNEPLARVLGVRGEDMIGKMSFDFFPPDRAERYAADDAQALLRGERIVSEEQVHATETTATWIETTMSPYRDSTGEVAGLVGITRDVTVRHAAAEQLRESARHYQLLFERNPFPMWVYDTQTLRFLSVNDAAIEHYGYDRETFLTMTIEDIRPAEHRTSLAMALETPRATRSAAESFVHVTRGGRRLDTEVVADSITMNGRSARLVLARDVTQERSAECALRESEERYRTLFVESLAGNYVSTVDGRLLACNPTFARMMGYDTPEEACEHPTTGYYASESSRHDFLALVRAKKRVELHEDSLQRRDGSVLQILENVIGHFDADGELAEIHGFVIDVTDRKRLEEQLRHSQKLQAVGQLAGGIAHDFNNLLTAMKLHGEFVLEDMAEDNPQRADILEMQLAADRATGHTRQLLAFSRKQLLNPKVNSANAVIEGMAPMVRRLIGEDVTINIVLDPAAGCVMADPGQVEQVILNLAVNARDAMSRGGTFTIATGIMILDPARASVADLPAGSYVSLTASDTGCGMSADVLTRIFEPFFTTKEQGKGTGLGLATVYGIVKQSGGHIWVSSVPDVGTSFEILFPRVNELPAEVVVTPSAPRGTETILVVEDDPAVQALTHRLLQRQGYTVLVASDGAEALDRVATAESDIALVLTDVVMPALSGGELAANLAVSHPELSVMFMSGYTNDVIVRRGLLDASATFLQKPFTATTLASAVREALDARTPAMMTRV